MMLPGVYALFTLLYCLFLGRIRKAWWMLRHSSGTVAPPPDPFVSVIVPIRNEAAVIGALLDRLLRQDYPADRWELIVVDDGSTDNSGVIVQEKLARATVKWKLLSLETGLKGSKKQAVSSGIEQAQGDWILTTDGDCLPGESWIRAMTMTMQAGVVMVAGPVRMLGEPTFFGRLQTYEWIGLQCIGAAGIQRRRFFFCNGANLAYTKSAFLDAGGFSSRKMQLSGDDTDLLLRFRQRWPEGIRFQSDPRAIVETGAARGLNAAFNQRHRWASKIPVALTWYTLLVALTAWIAHAMMLSMVVRAFTMPLVVCALLPFFLMKPVAEYLLLKDGGDYFGQRVSFPVILAAQPLYAVYITLVGAAAVFLPYAWKGRKGT